MVALVAVLHHEGGEKHMLMRRTDISRLNSVFYWHLDQNLIIVFILYALARLVFMDVTSVLNKVKHIHMK